MKLSQFCQPYIDSSGPAPKAINKHRTCRTPGCTTPLNIYNHSPFCHACQEKAAEQKSIRREKSSNPNRDSNNHKIGTCETCKTVGVKLIDYHDCGKCWWKKYKFRKGLGRKDRMKIIALIGEGKSNQDIAAHGFEMRHIEAVRGMA